MSCIQKRYEEKALEILKKAKVVAMTTTGAAIHQRLLGQLQAPIAFVEEAAEILESNLLAVLTPHVKHMVLIGDQKQLRPTVRCLTASIQNNKLWYVCNYSLPGTNWQVINTGSMCRCLRGSSGTSTPALCY